MNFEMNCLLAANEPLRKVSFALTDLVEGASEQVLLKDTQTGKYVLCSPRTADLLGVALDDLIGLTIDDFATRDGIWKWNFSPAFIAWKNEQPELIKKLDYQVQTTRRPAVFNNLTFTSEGFICIKKVVKRPVLNEDASKTIAILNVSHDQTLERSLPDLLQLYEKYYSTDKAIKYLLMHLDIDGYFTELPTPEEMQTLLALHQDFELADETVSPHIYHLQKKVERSCWNEMLTRLRTIPTKIH